MKEFYPTKSLWGQPRMHKPIYLVGLLWFDRTVHNLSLCTGLPRIFQYTDLSSHWPFPVKVYSNPTSLWTIGFMLWKPQLLCGLVDWQNVQTQLLNGILGPSCCVFFVVWIVVTVSVRGGQSKSCSKKQTGWPPDAMKYPQIPRNLLQFIRMSSEKNWNPIHSYVFQFIGGGSPPRARIIISRFIRMSSNSWDWMGVPPPNHYIILFRGNNNNESISIHYYYLAEIIIMKRNRWLLLFRGNNNNESKSIHFPRNNNNNGSGGEGGTAGRPLAPPRKWEKWRALVHRQVKTEKKKKKRSPTYEWLPLDTNECLPKKKSLNPNSFVCLPIHSYVFQFIRMSSPPKKSRNPNSFVCLPIHS